MIGLGTGAMEVGFFLVIVMDSTCSGWPLRRTALCQGRPPYRTTLVKDSSCWPSTDQKVNIERKKGQPLFRMALIHDSETSSMPAFSVP